MTPDLLVELAVIQLVERVTLDFLVKYQ